MVNVTFWFISGRSLLKHANETVCINMCTTATLSATRLLTAWIVDWFAGPRVGYLNKDKVQPSICFINFSFDYLFVILFLVFLRREAAMCIEIVGARKVGWHLYLAPKWEMRNCGWDDVWKLNIVNSSPRKFSKIHCGILRIILLVCLVVPPFQEQFCIVNEGAS